MVEEFRKTKTTQIKYLVRRVQNMVPLAPKRAKEKERLDKELEAADAAQRIFSLNKE